MYSSHNPLEVLIFGSDVQSVHYTSVKWLPGGSETVNVQRNMLKSTYSSLRLVENTLHSESMETIKSIFRDVVVEYSSFWMDFLHPVHCSLSVHPVPNKNESQNGQYTHQNHVRKRTNKNTSITYLITRTVFVATEHDMLYVTHTKKYPTFYTILNWIFGYEVFGNKINRLILQLHRVPIIMPTVKYSRNYIFQENHII